MGDLRYGRTVHSLPLALSLFNCKLHFISPESLTMPDYVKENESVLERFYKPALTR